MLKLEKSYTDKDGNEVTLSTPRMKVLGKLMDDDEKVEVIILTDEIKEFKTDKMKFPINSLYVKFDGEVEAFNLELGSQAIGVIKATNFKKGDKLTLTKGKRDDPKTGAVVPIVIAEVKENKIDLDNAWFEYKKLRGNIVGLNDFIGWFYITHLKNKVKELVGVYNQHVSEPITDTEVVKDDDDKDDGQQERKGSEGEGDKDKVSSPETKPKTLLQQITDLDSGAGIAVDELIQKAGCTEQDIKQLMSAGDIFEIRPGYVKVL